MKKHIIILAGLALITLLCVFQCEYLDKSVGEITNAGKAIVHSPVLKKRSDSLQTEFNQVSKSLERENDSLRKQLKAQQSNLAAYRFKAKLLEQELLKKVSQRSPVPKQVSQATVIQEPSVSENDTLIKPLLEEYVEMNALKDSACDSTINNLTVIAENQQKELDLCKELNGSLKDLSADQENDIRQLSEALKAANKQQHRRVVKNRVLAAGLVFVSGLAGALLIQHHK